MFLTIDVLRRARGCTQVGVLNIEMVPCSASGREYTEKDDIWIDDPDELVGKDFHFVVKVKGARGLPERYTVCGQQEHYPLANASG